MRQEKTQEILQVVHCRHVLSMQKKLLEKNMDREIFEVICILLHPPFIQLDLRIVIDLPERIK